jgi:hypothetical protein
MDINLECMCDPADRTLMLLTGRLACELCPESQIERDAVALLMLDDQYAISGTLLGLAATYGKTHAESVRIRAFDLWRNRL